MMVGTSCMETYIVPTLTTNLHLHSFCLVPCCLVALFSVTLLLCFLVCPLTNSRTEPAEPCRAQAAFGNVEITVGVDAPKKKKMTTSLSEASAAAT